ncbi:MAG: hypothetical protein QM654_16510 [Dysgonamonadaceae bacterium]
MPQITPTSSRIASDRQHLYRHTNHNHKQLTPHHYHQFLFLSFFFFGRAPPQATGRAFRSHPALRSYAPAARCNPSRGRKHSNTREKTGLASLHYTPSTEGIIEISAGTILKRILPPNRNISLVRFDIENKINPPSSKKLRAGQEQSETPHQLSFSRLIM